MDGNYPIVYPTWGQNIGGGIQLGMEGVMQGLAQRYERERQNALMARQQQQWEMDYAAKLGMPPFTLEELKKSQQAAQQPLPPQLGPVMVGQGTIQSGQIPGRLVQPGPPRPSPEGDLWREYQQVMQKQAPTLLPQEQALLGKTTGMAPEAFAGVRPTVAQMAMPTQVFNPLTGQYQTLGPKVKTAMSSFLRPQYRTVGDAVVKITPTAEGGEQLSEIGLSPMAVGKARDAANQFNAALDSLNRISTLTQRIYVAEKPADLMDVKNIFNMLKQGVKIKAEQLAKTNTDVVQLSKAMNAFISLDVKALGDVGNLAYQDIERVKKAMPTLFENRESAAAGINLIRDVLETAADRRLQSYSAPVTRQNIGGLRQTGKMTPPIQPKQPLPNLDAIDIELRKRGVIK